MTIFDFYQLQIISVSVSLDFSVTVVVIRSLVGEPHQTTRKRHVKLEKLWGGGVGEDFWAAQIFFSLSNSLYELLLGRSMNIF